MIARALRPALLLAGLLACLMPATAGAWTAAAAACLQNLDLEADAQRPFAEACPAASAALRGDAWSVLLVEPDTGWSVRTIRNLVAIVEDYRPPPAGPEAPPAALDAVLAGLPAAAGPQAPSAWQRLREWLVGLLDGRQVDVPEWLETLSVPDRLARTIWYAAAVVIVLLAGAIVVNELRYRRARRHAPSRPSAVAARTVPPDLAPAALAGRPPRQQLELLLRLVLLRLQAHGLLPSRPGLTHREIAAAAGLGDTQRHALQRLSAAAERAVYGAWSPAPEDVEAQAAAARRLLGELGAPVP